MEVTLLNRSVYSIPSTQRVGALVFDGPADMQVWPGPGVEADLREHYGPGLQRALDNELKQVPGRMLEIPSVIRVHQGRLHCNFLMWAASRESEPGSERTPAPDLDIIRQIVKLALEFAETRHVARIAFPALGSGPGERPREERLTAIVKAAQSYYDTGFAAGRRSSIEEVLVCEASGPAFRKARESTRGIAKVAQPDPVVAAPKPAARRSAKAGGTRASSTSRAKKKAGLSPEEIANHQGSAKYNMKQTYAVGDFFVHPKFGVGKVLELPAPGQIACVFEDGSERKLVHNR